MSHNGGDGDEFFPKFGEPIDLSDSIPVTVAHLKNPAALALAGEMLLIVPEVGSPVPGIVDYKIVNVRGLARYMEELEASRGIDEFDAQEFLNTAAALDRSSEEAGNEVPKGMMLLGHEEAAIIGRETSPQLDLPVTVSRQHADIYNSEKGLKIQDSLSTNGTRLFLHPDDAARPLPELASERPIENELRDEIFAALKDLCDENGNMQYKSEDGRLSVIGGHIMVEAREDDALVGKTEDWLGFEFLISRADDYPELKPGDNFRIKKLYVDDHEQGVAVADIMPKEYSLRPGIVRPNRRTQLTKAGAQQMLELIAFLKTQDTAR